MPKKKERSPASFRKKTESKPSSTPQQHASPIARFHFHSRTGNDSLASSRLSLDFLFCDSLKRVSCFALYCCALKTAILSSELSCTKGHHFEMFLARFDISIFTHGYKSLWLNSNIVLYRNIR